MLQEAVLAFLGVWAGRTWGSCVGTGWGGGPPPWSKPPAALLCLGLGLLESREQGPRLFRGRCGSLSGQGPRTGLVD